MIRVAALTGPDLAAALDDVARLRIAVFHDFPYLYDGNLDYERGYLTALRDSSGATVIGAWDGLQLVGAATGTPLSDHAADFAVALEGRGPPLDQVFYCAESVLLPGFRGHGIGHRFFDLREAHARALGFRYSAFCAVIRPSDHPARPAGYRPLDAFWQARGYARLPGAIANFSWRDLGDSAETAKPMQFWIRPL